MKARIVSGAGRSCMSKNLKPSSGITKEFREYIDKLVSLENTVLNVRRTYDKRIVLEYPVHGTTKDGRSIVGIDVEAEYVEIVEQ